jgi:hypothetical protein
MPPINFLAVLVAAVAGWLVGAVWYGVLGRQWMAALGRAEDTRRSIPVTPMIIAFIALIVMATMLAGLIGHLGPVNAERGVVSGVLVWFGFVITTIAVGNAFQQRKPMLTIIDGGHWLAVLVVQGAIIGAFGA